MTRIKCNNIDCKHCKDIDFEENVGICCLETIDMTAGECENVDIYY